MAAMESSSAELLWWTEEDEDALYQFEEQLSWTEEDEDALYQFQMADYGSTSSSLLPWSYILEEDLLGGVQLANEMYV
ncbi:uncharacterized protein [Dendropsophus ebraccatus]|uniref:uncharacterized protein n=1 Tax=Dendropsophus ebraccatus TaxID=150705 RepID=UPI00383139EF